MARIARSLTVSDGVSGGTARRVGGVAYRAVAASTAITGTTETEANFSEKYTIPAFSLAGGSVIRVRAQGIHTATTGAETHDILLKLGSTTVASKLTIDPADNDIFYLEAIIQIRTSGSSGTFVAAGTIATGATGSAAPAAFFKASTAVDTTAALDVAIAIDRQAAATDADSARLDLFVVEVIG